MLVREMHNSDPNEINPAGIWCQNDVELTSMRRDDVASTLIRRHFGTKCPLGNFPVKIQIGLIPFIVTSEQNVVRPVHLKY